ncbi:serine/threonine protein kinase [Alcanivorax sp. S71-1-4]|jgi:Ser/Thr protein kinase RdoA (MazF antagonist)|uniref:serine/threonine protein kinase n=1 Tax=Alcanivorax sp. S71-1-4 TaxID=1177159 RepID=UPI001359B506|nr:serine/threonine protein kinase [Alcanivorax sp. S71-1-4]KAF0805513.1 serine/threonine protein kinase [Alcanivorax sp. S71-1-4]
MDQPVRHPFDALSPDVLLDAVESLGYVTDGRLLALNSYENRVWQVGLEDQTPIIAKFYRPQRWSEAQILEEHAFSFELVEHEMPVVAPLRNDAGDSLFRHGDFRFALYPRKGGHAPELANPDHLLILGRFLGRLHNIGAIRPFEHRPTLTSQEFGHDAVAYVSEHFVPMDLKTSFDSLARDLLQAVDAVIASVGPVPMLRVHGDCHVGNVLWRDNAPHFIDLDDARMAPAVQDIWMLLSGERDQQARQLAEILEGYEEFRDFQNIELRLIDALRTLRMLHFSAWIARRWDDPAFPKAFPWFDSPRYWGEQILTLRNQMAELNEQPLPRL